MASTQLTPYNPPTFNSHFSTSQQFSSLQHLPSPPPTSDARPPVSTSPTAGTSADMNAFTPSSQNPLIPKRRRRTTQAELAILEQEFSINPLPTQAERAKLALRVGMTGRATQVWFQNRRQKEKREAGSYQGGTGSGTTPSPPNSAPDPDVDTSDAGDFTFSSSPVPRRTSSVYFPLPQLGTDTSASFDTIPFLRPSLEIYGNVNVPTPAAPMRTTTSSLPDKTNILRTLPPPPYSILSTVAPPKKDLKPTQAPQAAPAPQPSHAAFIHRPSGTSIIAAKKHVKKRPLGSHAPLARTPALSHTFDFPPSPPKGSARSAPSTLKRRDSTASTNSVASNASTLFSMNEGGRARVWVDALAGGAGVGDAIDHVVESGAKKARRTGKEDEDQVWTHMPSDLPSPSNSPAPLTRKMMRALAAESSGLEALAFAGSEDLRKKSSSSPLMNMNGLVGMMINSGKRKSEPRSEMPRKLSLARDKEGSRAGGEETCAFTALERKRARMNDGGLSSSRPIPTRTRSTPALRFGPPHALSRTSSTTNVLPSTSSSSSSTFIKEAKVDIHLSRRPSSSSTALNNNSTGGKSRVFAVCNPNNIPETLSDVDAPFELEDGEDTDSSMGELSFGSTSTSTTVSTVASLVDSENMMGMESEKSGNRLDDDRECAELLLGLGGFF
ncbi:hypothetical protein P7C70_g2628, partial [Phenoliferia sp. Uapishka_3]